MDKAASNCAPSAHTLNPPDLPHCHFYLPRKKRRCRMPCRKDELYCGEHSISPTRQPCPLDPKHTVAVDKLEEHISKLCNARLNRLFTLPYVKERINCRITTTKSPPHEGSGGADGCPLPPPSNGQADFRRIAAIVELVVDAAGIYPKEQYLQAGLVELLLASEEMGFGKRKHLTQISSIVGHLLANSLLSNLNNHCVVELGSGKAQLTYWMAQQCPETSYVLLDRQGCRNKFDRKALRENESLNLERIRCPVEHIDLSEVDTVKQAVSVAVVCKHFCGAATDYGIRALLAPGIRSKLIGAVLAPCCHHHSLYDEFVGADHLALLGITGVKDFHTLQHISSWAFCAMPKDNDGKEGGKTHEIRSSTPPSSSILTPTALHLPYSTEGEECSGTGETVLLCDTPTDKNTIEAVTVPPEWSNAEKEALGRKARILLEIARVDYLRRELGEKFSVQLSTYVPVEISPENLLIVVAKKESSCGN